MSGHIYQPHCMVAPQCSLYTNLQVLGATAIYSSSYIYTVVYSPKYT